MPFEVIFSVCHQVCSFRFAVSSLLHVFFLGSGALDLASGFFALLEAIKFQYLTYLSTPPCGRRITPCRTKQVFRDRRLHEQTQERLAGLIGLGQHGCAGLLQDTKSRKFGTFCCNIHLGNPAIGRFKIGFIDCKDISCKSKSGLLGTIVCSERGDGLNGPSN